MGDYTADAQIIVNSAQKIKEAIENESGTTLTMVILSELLKMSQVATDFSNLPVDQRDEFFAEVFDAAIGNEPNALVQKVGFFSGDVLEQMSDAIKAGALAYFNKELTA